MKIVHWVCLLKITLRFFFVRLVDAMCEQHYPELAETKLEQDVEPLPLESGAIMV